MNDNNIQVKEHNNMCFLWAKSLKWVKDVE